MAAEEMMIPAVIVETEAAIITGIITEIITGSKMNAVNNTYRFGRADYITD